MKKVLLLQGTLEELQGRLDIFTKSYNIEDIKISVAVHPSGTTIRTLVVIYTE